MAKPRRGVMSRRQAEKLVKLFSPGNRHMQTARSHNNRTKQVVRQGK